MTIVDVSLELLRCADCGGAQRHPESGCRHCLSENLSRVAASGSGSLYALSVVGRAPSPRFEADAPYAICLVDLTEGVRVLGRLDAAKPTAVPANAPVRFVPTPRSVAGGWLRFVATAECPETSEE